MGVHEVCLHNLFPFFRSIHLPWTGTGTEKNPLWVLTPPIAAAVRFSTTPFILYRLSPQADQNSLTWNAHNAPNPPCTWSVLVVETFLNLSKGCLYVALVIDCCLVIEDNPNLNCTRVSFVWPLEDHKLLPDD